MLQSLYKKIKTGWQVGPTKTCWLAYYRWKKQRFIKDKKKEWILKLVQDDNIGHKINGLPGSLQASRKATPDRLLSRGQDCSSKAELLHTISNSPLLNACSTMLEDHDFIQNIAPSILENAQRYKRADKAAQPTINVVGYGSYTFADHNTIDWHCDITTTTPSPTKWIHDFFADIVIPEAIPKQVQNDNRGIQNDNPSAPDIKVPWELSRMHQLVDLGLGYQQACRDNNVEKKVLYGCAFVQHIDSWIAHNPFPFSVNWINPMEIAIRSINILWATALFSNEPTISSAWWNNLSDILKNHAIFIENNWEVSSKTNNHYLADLVGFFYLNCFFSDHKKIVSTLIKITRAFTEQILPDGTSYEGSTAYHRLDTELLAHVLFLCKHMHIPVPQTLTDMYKKMQKFIEDCTDDYGNFATIGDDDGGKIVWGYHVPPSQLNTIKTYPDFGLTIIKNNSWHITFRHATFNNKQPSGHFHYDALSITVFLHGIPLICDPGSYVYTSSAWWRNTFRSADYHSTIFVEQATCEHSLFQLNRTNHAHRATVTQEEGKIIITDSVMITKNLRADRRLIFDQREQTLTITDCITEEKTDELIVPIIKTLHWGPDIELEKKSLHEWRVKREKRTLAMLFSDVDAIVEESYCAPTYGTKTKTQTWKATTSAHKKHSIVLRIAAKKS